MIIQQSAVSSFASPVLDLLQHAIMWVAPAYDKNKLIEDFEVAYLNDAAVRLLNADGKAKDGLRILRDGLPSPTTAGECLLHCIEVYHTGVIKDFNCSLLHTVDGYQVVCRKFEDGVLISFNDRKAERAAELKEKENALLLNGIITNAPVGITVYESVRDSSGNLLDFRVKLYNEFIHKLTGVSEEERKQRSLKELMIALGTEKQFDRYIETVETGLPFSSEYFNIRMKAWFQVSVVKLGDGFLTMLTDISQLKQSQHELETQSRFANSILNASLNGIYVLEAVRNEAGDIIDLIFLQGNKKFTELTGKPIEDLIGKSFLNNFSATKENGFFGALINVIRTGQPHQNDSYYAPSFKRWYNLMAVRLDLDRVVVTFQEITQQRDAGIQIAKQKSLLDNILSNSPNGIMVYQALRDNTGAVYDFRCVVVNQAAEQFSQINNEVRLSKTVLEITPHFRGTSLFNKALAAIEENSSFQIEHYSAKANKWLKLSYSKMDDNHLINVITDITHVRAAQQEMERLIEELKRSNKSLEEFAYAASHDLQEPLRKIHTFSDRLKHELSSQLDENQKRMFGRIEDTTKRMRNLIEDLLTYSQVSSDAELFSEVDLNKVLKKVIHTLDPYLAETYTKLDIQRLPEIKGNEKQMFQLFFNLISNAIKYGQENISPVIQIQSRIISASEWGGEELPSFKSDTYHLITVKDNGIGFDQIHAEKIFQVFQRLHGQSQYQGTGVGLAIVQKVIANHKGYIRAESAPGTGTTISFILPV